MATTGIVNGNDLGIFIGSEFIACTTDATISMSREVIEATCKDNGGARQVLGGSLSWTMTAAGLWKFDAGYGIEDLVDAILADTTLTARWSMESSTIGDFYLEGSVKVTSVEASSPVNGAATWSVTFEGSGLPTKVITT
jgi:predicted secreted protein